MVNNMRLIDADAFDKRLVRLGALSIKSALDEEPTIDAVPVVRCKDCKHYQNGRVFTDIKFCFRLKDRKGKAIGYTRSDNDFCSYGERKE